MLTNRILIFWQYYEHIITLLLTDIRKVSRINSLTSWNNYIVCDVKKTVFGFCNQLTIWPQTFWSFFSFFLPQCSHSNFTHICVWTALSIYNSFSFNFYKQHQKSYSHLIDPDGSLHAQSPYLEKLIWIHGQSLLPIFYA